MLLFSRFYYRLLRTNSIVIIPAHLKFANPQKSGIFACAHYYKCFLVRGVCHKRSKMRLRKLYAADRKQLCWRRSAGLRGSSQPLDPLAARMSTGHSLHARAFSRFDSYHYPVQSKSPHQGAITLVRPTGIEPARFYPQEPKSCVSASSTTAACAVLLHEQRLNAVHNMIC